MATYLPQLHSFYQNMRLTLGQDNMNEVSAAIAHIIAGLPAPQRAAAMSTFCMPLVEGLHSAVVRKQPPTKQDFNTKPSTLIRKKRMNTRKPTHSHSLCHHHSKNPQLNPNQTITALPPLPLLLLLLTTIHLIGLKIYSDGFLLTRITIKTTTTTQPDIQPTHKKLILVLIDALRYDFILPHNQTNDPHNQNQLTTPTKLTTQQPNHSRLFHFQADPPTTTLQRLKALTTGTLPTFIDIGSNFASTNLGIDEDNWLDQLHQAHRRIGFAGDDTWLKIFGHHLFQPNLTFPFESFNVEDLHTVDNGVKTNLYRILNIDQPTKQQQEEQQDHWDILIAHFLGLDHAGHRFGASHPAVRSKLREYDDFLKKLVENLDDQTLLVLIGDHGMDSKGDHGGDSFLEVSTALWIYSKTRPLLQDPLPSWALDHHQSFLDLEASIGRTRTVSQIDLVPTLSLMLGLPIPFSNLGMIIPEFFFQTTPSNSDPPSLLSPTQTLLRAASLNSQQLWTFLDRHTSNSSHDLSQHFPHLTRLYRRALELSQLPGHEEEAFQAHRTFATSLLATSRKIWAKFEPDLMLIGILLMALSLLVSSKLLSCISPPSTTQTPPVHALLLAGLSGGGLGLLIGGVSAWIKLFPEIATTSNLIIGTALGISLGILSFQPNHHPTFSIPSFTTLFKLFPVILHGLGLGSNSYTVWEDRVVLHLLSISLFLPLMIRAFSVPKPALRNRLLFFASLFALCLRLISLSTVCREEQGGECRVTFYGSATSSNAPNWVMSLSIPLAIGLPIVPAWFLGISDSYRGPASFFFGVLWRLILLCGSQYWITDYIISHQDLDLSSNLIETAQSVKLLVARVAFFLCLFAASLLWIILPVCIDVKRVDSEPESNSEPKEKGENKKPKLLVIGFANVYGSSYLMFLVACFGILFLVTQPVGQVVLSLGLVAILCLVELNDTLNDIDSLRESYQKAIETVAVTNKAKDEEEGRMTKIPPTDLNILVGFYFLGYMLFFGSGHQATFASIQWKAGFVGLPQAHLLWSAVLVFLNSFAGFILVGLALPLLKIWNLSPIINLNHPNKKRDQDDQQQQQQQLDRAESEPSRSSPTPVIIRTLDTQLFESQLKFINFFAINLVLNMLFILFLRRHLMVWKIFSPRFMLHSILLLLVDFVAVFVTLGPVRAVKAKVNRTFGTQFFA
jgi:phosphatidylinositol glycan class O